MSSNKLYLFCLRYSPWEAIKQESIFAVRLIQVLVNHIHNHLIRDQFAFIHDLFEAAAEF